jgi:hypothetical protein
MSVFRSGYRTNRFRLRTDNSCAAPSTGTESCRDGARSRRSGHLRTRRRTASEPQTRSPPPAPAAIPAGTTPLVHAAPESGTGGPVVPPWTPEVGLGVGDGGQVVLEPVVAAPTPDTAPSPATAIVAAHASVAAYLIALPLRDVGWRRRRRNPNLPSDPPDGGGPRRVILRATTSTTTAQIIRRGSAGASGMFGGGPPGHVLAYAKISGPGAQAIAAATPAATTVPMASLARPEHARGRASRALLI